MPKRVAPTLTEYVPATRMGEGVYKEVVTEYRVRTDLPFQIATLGATIGGNGSTYLSCAGQAVVYKLEPGKDYEALVGVRSRSSNDGEQALICMFGVIELVSLPGTSIVISQKLTPAAPPQVVCKTDQHRPSLGGFASGRNQKAPAAWAFALKWKKKATRLSRLSLAIRLSGYSMTSNTLPWHRRGGFAPGISSTTL